MKLLLEKVVDINRNRKGNSNMKYGCFGFSNQLTDIAAAGFDSAELDFCELTDMTNLEFTNFYKKASSSKLNFEVFSGLLPLTERFHSSSFHLDYWLEHTARGAKRAKELGCVMIPFGAGKCRSIPDDIDPEEGKATVASIVRSFSELLQEYDIKLIVEPLGTPNSNYLNTLAETNEFLKKVQHPNCSAMCDLRHMHKSNEAFSEIVKYRSIVKHAHIDYPRKLTRYFPSPEDDFDYLPYFQALSDANYQGLLTVEATAVRQNFLQEASICCEYLKKLENSVN